MKFKDPKKDARKIAIMKNLFGIYDKIYEETNKLDEMPMILKGDVMGVKVKIERYPNTWCLWEKIRYLKEGKEVYRITLNNRYKEAKGKTLDIGIRKEYFFGRLFREYKSDQFCFVEFCDFWENHKRFPNNKELAKFGLKKDIAKGYEKFARKIAIGTP